MRAMRCDEKWWADEEADYVCLCNKFGEEPVYYSLGQFNTEHLRKLRERMFLENIPAICNKPQMPVDSRDWTNLLEAHKKVIKAQADLIEILEAELAKNSR